MPLIISYWKQLRNVSDAQIICLGCSGLQYWAVIYLLSARKKISLRSNVKFPCKRCEETVTSYISPVSICFLQCPPKVQRKYCSGTSLSSHNSFQMFHFEHIEKQTSTESDVLKVINNQGRCIFLYSQEIFSSCLTCGIFAGVVSYCTFYSVQNYISSPTMQNQYISVNRI